MGSFFRRYKYTLSSRRLLLHLEELELQCQGPFSIPFFYSLPRSSVQHLRLRMFYIYEDFSIIPPSLLAETWPLRTLHLELMTDHQTREITTAPFPASILRLCAPTLKALTWIDRCKNRGHSFATAALNPTPCFTHLRNVILSRISFLGSSTLDACYKIVLVRRV